MTNAMNYKYVLLSIFNHYLLLLLIIIIVFDVQQMVLHPLTFNLNSGNIKKNYGHILICFVLLEGNLFYPPKGFVKHMFFKNKKDYI